RVPRGAPLATDCAARDEGGARDPVRISLRNPPTSLCPYPSRVCPRAPYQMRNLQELPKYVARRRQQGHYITPVSAARNDRYSEMHQHNKQTAKARQTCRCPWRKRGKGQ